MTSTGQGGLGGWTKTGWGGSISSKNGKINYGIPTFVENLVRTMNIL